MTQDTKGTFQDIPGDSLMPLELSWIYFVNIIFSSFSRLFVKTRRYFNGPREVQETGQEPWERSSKMIMIHVENVSFGELGDLFLGERLLRSTLLQVTLGIHPSFTKNHENAQKSSIF